MQHDRQLLLVRHAQTNYNQLALCNDDPRVDVHLTAEGIRQAQVAAESLRGRPLDCILISELPRTAQTAAIINRYHQAPLRVDPRLNDIRTGFESRPVADYFAAVGHDRFNIRPVGGESLRDFQARVLPLLDELRSGSYRRILIVTHEETLRVLTGALRNIKDNDIQKLTFDNCQIEPFQL